MFEVTHRYLAVCFPVCVLRYSSSLIQARLSLITPNLALKIRAKQHVSFVSITLSPQKENPLQLRQIIQFLFVGTFFAKLFFFFTCYLFPCCVLLLGFHRDIAAVNLALSSFCKSDLTLR